MSEPRQGPHGESSGATPVDAIEAALDAFRHGRGAPPWVERGGPDAHPLHPHGGPGVSHRGPTEPAESAGPGSGGHGLGARGHGHAGPGGRWGWRGGPPGFGPHEGFGLGPVGGRAAIRLLAALASDGPQSVSQLATAIGVDQPRASRLAQAAIDAGQVRREADPRDARRSMLILTEAGRTLLTDAHQRRRTAIETALSGFDERERAEFARLLTRFVAAWPHGR